MTYDFYLQGSYSNDTNIQGNSDVDVILKFNHTFYYDASSLSLEDQNHLRQLPPARYTWDKYRREAFTALKNKFNKLVVQGNKSIKIKTDTHRLAADVVVCNEYRKYNSLDSYVEGVAFKTSQDNRLIKNYPKQHYDNGVKKNSNTRGFYKRTVRMFKNARNYLEDTNIISRDLAPSYFLECLLYNAPDATFQHDFGDTYFSIVKWMNHADISDAVCQNGQRRLFGQSIEDWSHADAKNLAERFMALWTNWT